MLLDESWIMDNQWILEWQNCEELLGVAVFEPPKFQLANMVSRVLFASVGGGGFC